MLDSLHSWSTTPTWDEIWIKVVGVGGGGSNAVARMFRERIPGIEYAVINTDSQALLRCDVPLRIGIGDELTEGKGVGGEDSHRCK